MDDLKQFARYFRPYKVPLTIGIVCIFAGVCFNLYIPLIVGQAVYSNWTTLFWSMLTLSGVKAFGGRVNARIFLFLQRRKIIRMLRNVGYDPRQNFFSHSGK